MDDFTTYTISNKFHSVKQYDVVCVNAYTKKRDRMSVILRDPSNSEQYLVVVKGSATAFRDSFSLAQMGEKELNGYKSMLTDYRLQGLGRVILAAKRIYKSELQEYLSIYNTISDSSREQLSTFEVHANKLEQNLFFIGCIGTKDIVKEESHKLVFKMQEAGLQINMLSGDMFDNCINVARELKITRSNLSDTTSFFHLNFKSERQGMMDMQRILDTIYDLLLEQQLRMTDELLEKDKHTPSAGVFGFLGVSSSDNSSNQRSDEPGPSGSQNKKQKTNELPPVDELVGVLKLNPALKRTILIQGKAVGCIWHHPVLREYFKIVLLFADAIIGYEMMPAHKAMVVESVKQLNSRCLAVGDGLNDRAMFAAAHVSIQISSPGVPLALADIIVNDLNTINYLLWSLGPKMFKNLMAFNLLSVWNNFQINILQVIHWVSSYFGDNLIQASEYGKLNWAFITASIVFGLMNSAYSISFIHEFPAVYRERSLIKLHYSRIMILLLAYILFMGGLIYLAISYVLADLVKIDGQRYSMQELSVWTSLLLGCSSIVRVLMMFNKAQFLQFGLYALILLGFLLYTTTPYMFSSGKVLDNYPLSKMLSNPTYLLLLVEMLAAMIIIDHVIIAYIWNHFIAPVSKLLRQVVNSKQVESFRLNSANMVADLIAPSENSRWEADVIQMVKRVCSLSVLKDPSVKRILSIDYFNFGLQIDSFNMIKDIGERRKFMKYRPPDETKYLRIFMGFTAVSSTIDYMLLVLYYDYRQSYFLECGSLYAILASCMMLALTYSPLPERLFKKISLWTKIAVASANAISNLLMVQLTWKNTMPAYIRYLVSPLASNFLVMSAMVIAHDMILILSSLWAETETSMYATGSRALRARRICGMIGLLFFKLMALRRYDRLMKLDFVSEERLQTEMSASNEKLVLLMPKFVLDRINYLEMSNNFVADDAGEVCVLFCDICEFDGVIEELQDNVVSLLDEVFRKFDGFCKLRGVQKIEVRCFCLTSDCRQDIHGLWRTQVPGGILIRRA